MAVGIEETKDILKFAIGLGNAVDKALADDGIGVSDIGLFLTPLVNAGSAFSGIDKVPSEIKDLSDEELKELCKFVEDEFDIRNDKAEAVVESAIKIGLDIYNVIKSFKK